MTSRSDVIVVGAGPAGAVAARTLAGAGFRVQLVDKSAFPRNKPCGGGVSARAFVRFPWLKAATQHIDVHAVSQMHLESPDGAVLEMNSTDPSVLLIRRIEFDHALVTEAARAGAELVERFEITQARADADSVTLHSRDGREMRASAVIAADGVHSVIAKRLGVNPKWPQQSIALDMMEETPTDTLRPSRPEVLWVSYGYKGLDGYSYIFPKTHHVNVGIGCLLSHYREDVDAHPYEMQSQFVADLVSKGALQGHSDRKHFTPFLIPVGGPLKRAADATGRVLFAGDAGGFVNAFTAEGIHYAMVSGEHAARAVIDGGAPQTIARRYDTLWRSEIGAELRDAVIIQRFLFSDQTRVSRVVRAGRNLPWLAELIVDYAAGRTTYREAKRRVLAASPKTAAKLAWMMVQKQLAG